MGIGYFLCEKDKNYDSLLIFACTCCRNFRRVHSVEPWEHRDQTHGYEGVFLSGLLVLWILNHVNVQSVFKNTHTKFKNRKKSIHRYFQSLPVSLCSVEAGESGSEFSPFSTNTNTMQLDTSHHNSLPLEKTGRQRNRTTVA